MSSASAGSAVIIDGCCAYAGETACNRRVTEGSDGRSEDRMGTGKRVATVHASTRDFASVDVCTFGKDGAPDKIKMRTGCAV